MEDYNYESEEAEVSDVLDEIFHYITEKKVGNLIPDIGITRAAAAWCLPRYPSG